MNLEEIVTLIIGMFIGGTFMQIFIFLLRRYDQKYMKKYFDEKYGDKK